MVLTSFIPPKRITDIKEKMDELKSKAEKWDMIQWAAKEGIEFINCSNVDNYLEFINNDDLDTLEQMYNEVSK